LAALPSVTNVLDEYIHLLCTTARLTMGLEHAFEEVMMPKVPQKQGKTWTTRDVQALEQLMRQNTPTRVIALKLERTPDAVYSKASSLGISLKPTNQSPYNRRTGSRRTR